MGEAHKPRYFLGRAKGFILRLLTTHILTCTVVEDFSCFGKDERLHHHKCREQRRSQLQENFTDVLGIWISATQGEYRVSELEYPRVDDQWN